MRIHERIHRGMCVRGRRSFERIHGLVRKTLGNRSGNADWAHAHMHV